MRILFVDDEPSILVFFQDIAKQDNFTDFTCVETGEDALTCALQGSFDLITLDISMPGLSGLDIVPLLRNLNPHGVIAVISAHIPDKISDEILGCVDVMLAKPVHAKVIKSLLSHAAKVYDGMSGVRSLSEVSS